MSIAKQDVSDYRVVSVCVHVCVWREGEDTKEQNLRDCGEKEALAFISRDMACRCPHSPDSLSSMNKSCTNTHQSSLIKHNPDKQQQEYSHSILSSKTELTVR